MDQVKQEIDTVCRWSMGEEGGGAGGGRMADVSGWRAEMWRSQKQGMGGEGIKVEE